MREIMQVMPISLLGQTTVIYTLNTQYDADFDETSVHVCQVPDYDLENFMHEVYMNNNLDAIEESYTEFEAENEVFCKYVELETYGLHGKLKVFNLVNMFRVDESGKISPLHVDGITQSHPLFDPNRTSIF